MSVMDLGGVLNDSYSCILYNGKLPVICIILKTRLKVSVSTGSLLIVVGL